MLEKMLEPILTEEILKRFGEGPENEKELVRSFLLSLAENPQTSFETRLRVAPNLIGGQSSEDHKARSCRVLLRLANTSEIAPEVCLDLAKTVAGYAVGAQKEQACAFILNQIQRLEGTSRQNSANIVFAYGSLRQRITASMILAGVDMPQETWRAIEERLFQRADELSAVSDKRMTTLINSLVQDESQESWKNIIENALFWEPGEGLIENVGRRISLFITELSRNPTSNELIRLVQDNFPDLTRDKVIIILNDLGVLQNDSDVVKSAVVLYSTKYKFLNRSPTKNEMRIALHEKFEDFSVDQITTILDELELFEG